MTYNASNPKSLTLSGKYFSSLLGTVNGAAGTDTIRLAENFSRYKFADLNNGTQSVTLVSLDDGSSIRLNSVERYVFADQTKSSSQISSEAQSPPRLFSFLYRQATPTKATAAAPPLQSKPH